MHDGRIPHQWLHDFDRILCPECGMVCAERNQCCTRCWPARRAAVPAAPGPQVASPDVPPLSEVLATEVPVLQHVSRAVRSRWGRILRIALGELAEFTLVKRWNL